jgi:branched-subunit amino acid transport protein
VDDLLRLWIVLLVATAVTYVWRGAAVAIAKQISPTGAVSQWFSCVAYAMLAGLIARIIVFPIGILAETLLIDRLIATGVSLTFFFLFRRNVLIGTVGGIAVFIALTGGRIYGFM